MQNAETRFENLEALLFIHAVPSLVLQIKGQAPGQILGPVPLHVLTRKTVSISV